MQPSAKLRMTDDAVAMAWIGGDYATLVDFARNSDKGSLSELAALISLAALDAAGLDTEVEEWCHFLASSTYRQQPLARVLAFIARTRLSAVASALYGIYPAVRTPRNLFSNSEASFSRSERRALLDAIINAVPRDLDTTNSPSAEFAGTAARPLVSVIVPVFNTSETLARCLDSISSQTFRDFEILAVDDCSTDDSLEHLRRYALHETRLRVIQHDRNRGLGAARNTGIKHARGDFLAGVDSDDSVLPGMLEALVAAATSTGADVVAAGYEEVGFDGKVSATRAFDDAFVVNQSNTWDPFGIVNPAFWNKLWRKTLFTSNNIYFPHTYFEDLATTPLLLAKANGLATTSYVGYRYYNTEGSITFSFTPRHLADYLYVFHRLRAHTAAAAHLPKQRKHLSRCIARSLRYTARRVSKRESSMFSRPYLQHAALLKKALRSHEPMLAALDGELRSELEV